MLIWLTTVGCWVSYWKLLIARRLAARSSRAARVLTSGLLRAMCESTIDSNLDWCLRDNSLNLSGTRGLASNEGTTRGLKGAFLDVLKSPSTEVIVYSCCRGDTRVTSILSPWVEVCSWVGDLEGTLVMKKLWPPSLSSRAALSMLKGPVVLYYVLNAYLTLIRGTLISVVIVFF